MNTRIKIYCILLAIVYVIFVVNSIYNGWDDFKAGFSSSMSNNKESTIHTSLIPTEGNTMVIKNELTGEETQLEITELRTEVAIPANTVPTYLTILHAFAILFCIIPALALLFAFPFIFFGLVYDITKNKIIEDYTILRTKILGWILISTFIFPLLYEIIEKERLKYILDVQGYKIMTVDFSNHAITLILGLIILLIADLLKGSLKMKEEQDLTI